MRRCRDGEVTMGEPKVKIVGITSIGEKMCAAGGRISTQEGTALEIWEKSQDEQKNENLIEKVTQSGHDSTIEHCFFNLVFDEVSVVTEQFMIEFRLASFTIKSRRYVDFSQAGYIIPEFNDDNLKEKYISHMDKLFSFYSKMVDHSIPKEDARFVLPYCFKSNFFCSMNARELLHVIEAMIYGRGKDCKEIFELGNSLLRQGRKFAPGIFKNFEQRHADYCDKLDLDYDKTEKYFDKPLCELLSYSPSAEKTVAFSALLECNDFSSDDINKILSDDKNIDNIINSVIRSKRPRALESISYTFRLNNVSLACLTHFTRHRMQSINIPSLTVCDIGSYILPDTVMNSSLKDEYIGCFDETKKLYEYFKLKGVPKQTLTYFLLAGNTIDFTLTMNARELLLFTKLRSCSRAQWEIQNYAVDMLKKLRDVTPKVFNFYGPSCFVNGVCPEGRLSCKKISQMREKFSV